MDSSSDLKELWSSETNDSNAIVLPGKKRKKDKGKHQLKPKNKSKLSNSQKRKLKKLEEEREKTILLSESIETLEKYKVQEDVYSLMWSSRNLGQVETVREKRRRQVQFSKAGLEVPHHEQSSKRRNSNLVPCVVKHEYEDANQLISGCDSLQSPMEEKEIQCDGSASLYFNDQIFGSACHTVGRDSANPSRDATNASFNSPKLEHCQSSGCIDDQVAKSEEIEGEKVALKTCSNLAKNPPWRTPTVVHVFRPKEVENKRQDLPIVMMEQEIMEAINENSCVIVCGETGCGKTTQVPQFLYEAGFGAIDYNGKGGIIGVTQPRRVAVLATAKRVAFELGLHLGKEVGFQVRHDRRVGENCSIKFMTDGILLREVQSDFLLRRYSVIILDEAHERSLNTDILVGMLSRVIRVRQREYEDQQKKILSGEIISPENIIYPLKLLLMSATMRVEDFLSGNRIFNYPPPVIEVPTRQYPVTVHFSKRTEIVDYIGQAYKKVLSIHKRLPPGGILVFVTGQREVEYLCRKLRKASRETVDRAEKTKNEAYSELGKEPTDGNDMKEISEAFQIEGNHGYEATDRFSYEEDHHVDSSEDKSDFSDDSGDESDLEAYNTVDLFNSKSLESNGNSADVLGEGGSLASLNAAFEALAGRKRICNSHSDGKEVVISSPEKGINHSVSTFSREIRDGERVSSGPMHVLPLYAMLPASAQLRVFEEVKEEERLVVVATNVAETSLTIPGIKYVVDTGREKVKNYDSSSGIETYEIQWISKASASQRAGRAGRTGPGHCYRLYSSAVFNNIFSDFSSAEILKVPVDGVVLLLKSMNIDKVSNFPFPTPPDSTALREAERCLKVLEALNHKGRLMPLGKVMARYPISPRHSRMLLTVIQIMRKVKHYARANLVLAYAVAAAAALSLSDPFLARFEGTYNNVEELKGGEDKSRDVGSNDTLEKEEKLRQKKQKESAKESRARFMNPTSDALTVAYALQCFELSENPTEFCSHNALHLKTMQEMSKLRKQLLQLVFNAKFYDAYQEFSWIHGVMKDVECAWRVSSSKHPLQLNEEEILCQAICAGWADRVAKRIKEISGLPGGDRKVKSVRYQACMVQETVFLHRFSSVSKCAPEFLVYSELLHTRRPEIRGATSVKASWLVKYAKSLCSFSCPLADPKPYYDPLVDQTFCWVTPTFGPHLWQLPLHSLAIEDDVTRVAVFACSLLEGQVLPCLKSVREFMAASPASILRPEASGLKRVGNLLNKLSSGWRKIDSCAMLRKLWDENPGELYSEILDWFQQGFHDQFEELWRKMHHQVLLDPDERFSKPVKREKRRK